MTLYSKDIQIFPEIIIVYTDGACSKNGKRGARGGIGVFFEPSVDIMTGHSSMCSTVCSMTVEQAIEQLIPDLIIEAPSNQKAELLAILKAVEIFKTFKNVKSKILHIKTDSMYSINALTIWSKNWVKNGWKAASGKPVLNKEIICKILVEIEDITIKLSHVKAHKTQPGHNTQEYRDWYGNMKADELAVTATRVHSDLKK